MHYAKHTHLPIAVRSAGVVILDAQKRILLVREALPSKAGLWHIPSGRVDRVETLEEAALLETKEETGLEVKLLA